MEDHKKEMLDKTEMDVEETDFKGTKWTIRSGHVTKRRVVLLESLFFIKV